MQNHATSDLATHLHPSATSSRTCFFRLATHVPPKCTQVKPLLSCQWRLDVANDRSSAVERMIYNIHSYICVGTMASDTTFFNMLSLHNHKYIIYVLREEKYEVVRGSREWSWAKSQEMIWYSGLFSVFFWFFLFNLPCSSMPCVACQRCNLGESDASQFSSTGWSGCKYMCYVKRSMRL